MIRYHGVKCKKCAQPIAVTSVSGSSIYEATYIVRLRPTKCPGCGYSQLYFSEDLVEFDTQDGLPVQP